MYSEFNDPKNYRHINNALLPDAVPTTAVFAANDGEQIIKKALRYKSLEDSVFKSLLDELDYAVIAEVGRSKYLTALQIYQYVSLKGFAVDRFQLRKQLSMLTKQRILRESKIVIPDNSNVCLHYFELDYFGNRIAHDLNVPFNKATSYISDNKRASKGYPDDVPCDVKRVLAGQQIILGLLINGCQMERFSVLETYRQNDLYGIDTGLFRTAVGIKVDPGSSLAFEIVRDTPESYAKLQNKIQRYYALVHNNHYLSNNYHNDSTYPQLIICGENYEHNCKIAVFLRRAGLLNTEDPLLFTEDLLFMEKNTLTLIYGLAHNNSKQWYSLPAYSKASDGVVA